MQLYILSIGFILSALALILHLKNQNKSGVFSVYTKTATLFLLITTAFLLCSTKMQVSYHASLSIGLILTALFCFTLSTIFSQLGNKYEFHLKQHSLASSWFKIFGLIAIILSLVLLANNQITLFTAENLLIVGIIIVISLLTSIILNTIFSKNILICRAVPTLNLMLNIFAISLSVYYFILINNFYSLILTASCLILLILEVTKLIKANKKNNAFSLIQDLFFVISLFFITLYIYFI